MSRDLDRRDFLRGSLLVPAAVLLPGCGDDGRADGGGPAAAATSLPATAACHDEPTDEVTEGPYFTPDSPLRRSLLEPGMRGTRLIITGRVLSTSCKPLARAVVDFWQADASGEYDNEGYTLRGHQRTDSKGRYRLETVVPGLYPGRTRHIHVKVARAGSRAVLTTQLFFAGERGNASDGIYEKSLEMRMGRRGKTRTGRFDFVLEV